MPVRPACGRVLRQTQATDGDAEPCVVRQVAELSELVSSPVTAFGADLHRVVVRSVKDHTLFTFLSKCQKIAILILILLLCGPEEMGLV